MSAAQTRQPGPLITHPFGSKPGLEAVLAFALAHPDDTFNLSDAVAATRWSRGTTTSALANAAKGAYLEREMPEAVPRMLQPGASVRHLVRWRLTPRGRAKAASLGLTRPDGTQAALPQELAELEDADPLGHHFVRVLRPARAGDFTRQPGMCTSVFDLAAQMAAPMAAQTNRSRA